MKHAASSLPPVWPKRSGRRWCAWLLVLVAAVSPGCQSTAWPTLWNHNPPEVQRHVDQQWDPYPEPTSGAPANGPDMDGARPLEYDAPRPQPRRLQTPPWNWWPWSGR